MIMIIARRSSDRQIFQLILAICCCFVAVSNAVPLKAHSTESDEYVKVDRLPAKGKMDLYESDDYGGTMTANEVEDGDYDSVSDQDYLGLDSYGDWNEPKRVKMSKKKPSNNNDNSTKRIQVEDLIASAINTDCGSVPNKNQRFSSSFVDLSKGRDMADHHDDEMDAKIMKSVHVGEDVTLCWIETTTIKENRSVAPPVRLVLREYTISFENSATIPNSYLECTRLPGEINPRIGIDEKLGQKGLFEIIDEDTKKSRIVNFTIVDHEGDVVIWKHKRVQCAVGSVVTKSILEWSNDNGKNSKKRVEIKVSPKLLGPDVQPHPSSTTAKPPLISSTDFESTTAPSLPTETSSDLGDYDTTTTDITEKPKIQLHTQGSTTVTDSWDTDSTVDAASTSESTSESDSVSTTTESTTVVSTEQSTTPAPTTELTEETESEESRRSTIPTPQTGTTTTDASSTSDGLPEDPEGKHHLILNVKVTLKHVNEHKETESLIEIEKNIVLPEGPHGHSKSAILDQVQALNDSVSLEKLQTLLNCSSLEKLNNRISNWAVAHYSTPLPEDYRLETTSASESLNETSSQRRKKRALNGNLNEDLRTGIDRLLDSSLAQEGRKNLSGAQEEERNRLGDNYHVLRRWTRETLAESSDGSGGLNTLTEFSVYATP